MKSPKLKWQARKWQELSRDDVYAILRCRVDVFVVEQRCPYCDPDGRDSQALHLTATDERSAILAYARILPPGIAYAGPAIGRILVAPQARGRELGKELVRRCIDVCRREFGSAPIHISAQLPLKDYYTSLGFVPLGSPYDEDGIMHIQMQLPD